MSPDKFSTLYDDWKRTESGGFVAPLVSDRPAQILIFPDQFKDATIVADVTPLEGKESPRKPSTGGKDASIVFCYSGFESFYYAGIGGFGTKFFIAKAMAGPVFQPLGSVGQQSSIQYKTVYHLRVECHGNRLTLYDNDVQQLMVFDETYQSGQWGIQSFRTGAQFDRVKIHVSQPRCFVVMPFLYSNKMGADVLLRENLSKAIRETMGYTVSKP